MTFTAEQHEIRRKRLGASEIAQACRLIEVDGNFPHGSAFELWELKTGRRSPWAGNERTEWGSRLERLVLDVFAESECIEILDHQAERVASIDPPIVATLDAIGFDGSEQIVVEAKTTTSDNKDLGESGSSQVPMEWLCQTQIQMHAAKMGNAMIACWLRDTCEMRVYRIEYHRVLCERLIAKAAEFWRYVAENKLPPADWANADERMRRAVYIDRLGEPIEFDEDAQKNWAEYELLGKQITTLEKQRDKLKDEITVALQDRSRGTLGDGREVVLQVINRKGYTVAPTSYCQLRARKVK